ncbi:hypothetical protein [Rubellimicrobium aerolatum]|uniref:DUF3329 domain-containing protein n=1 Tax=Rubellimicrobium aerolatum TaxID=490979 RepID=A0ABW0SBK0_9RHOB|nr:hypothetical protein [Rubellimicrobium aerolatum]MBP1805589.1 hypothetical protein [Rubellimicrobium aerolatum]
MDRFFDFNHPFFRPLWIRVLVVALCLGWAGVEFATGGTVWGILFGAIGLAALYGFFINFNPRPPGDR